MKISLVSRVGIIFKFITGIKDFSLFKKNLHKKIGLLLYHKKYTAKDLIELMKSMGMKEGSVICIHSSMKEFYNYTGTAEELISGILDVITPAGTLIMPAFPEVNLINNPDYIFNKEKDKTGAGYLAESFRKYPGVLRSINVQHSVCAIGKYAEWLIEDHHNGEDCWDDKSPWKRMLKLNAIVFNLGLPRSYMGTFHHCVESTLKYEHPYWRQFFNTTKTYYYYTDEGTVESYTCMTSTIERRTREGRITKHFTSTDWSIHQISNLEVKAYYTKHCFPKLIEFGRKGLSLYYVPSTKKYKF